MLFREELAILFLICTTQTMGGNNRDWWKYTTIYEIFVWSFKDSNGDGIGDLKGITSMLDHFVDLKIETIWLTPIYESPMVDAGYDVSDYYNVDPRFGTMEDFDELLTEMKKRGLRLAMDFVLNHSSDKHPWFLKSVDKIKPYTDYYVWKDAKGYDNNGTAIPPNNWLSIKGGSAWKWNSKRNQFYYHTFNVRQVDFDLRNPNLVKESKNIIKFWFDKGVAAGRIDAPICFVEDSLLRDEDYSIIDHSVQRFDWPDHYHKYTYNQWESYDFLHKLRKFVDYRYNSKDEDEKILFTETYTTWNHTMKYYGTKSHKMAHFPLNFLFTSYSNFESPKKLDGTIKKWLTKMPTHGIANWQVENHDVGRMLTTLNPEVADIMLIVIMMLPGVACIYYGQEVGLANTNLRSDQHYDVSGRDRGRSPMQWDNSINAGFSSNPKPWLPVNPNYWQLNLKTQKKDPNSRYNLYKSLSKLRPTPTLKYGNFTSYFVSTWVYAFVRHTDNSFPRDRSVIVVANMGSETEIVDLYNSIQNLPPVLEILAASSNSGFISDATIHTNHTLRGHFIMRPYSAVVLST